MNTTDRSAAAAALGSAKSPKKAAASRENGRKGGRPTGESRIRKALLSVKAAGDVSAAVIARDSSGWYVRAFDYNERTYLGATVAEALAYIAEWKAEGEATNWTFDQ